MLPGTEPFAYPMGVWYLWTHEHDNGHRNRMSCGHCATSVREEITEIPGVRAVDVDLASGSVTIESDSVLEAAAIKTAVEDAGYQLAS